MQKQDQEVRGNKNNRIMEKITFNEFVSYTDEAFINSNKKYLLKKYKEYLSLTKEDLDLLNKLKSNEGKEIIFHYGKNKKRKMILAYVQNTIEKNNDQYFSTLYDIRLNYIKDGIIREWDGFWTSKFKSIEINL